MPDYMNARVQDYLDQLASGESTPGGGSAAALTGALGAALLCMSARFTVGREKYAQHEAAAQEVLSQAEPLRADLQRLVELDADAYGSYCIAAALSRGTDEEKASRKRAIQEATRQSAQVPMEIARKCLRLLELADCLSQHCNPYLVSDVAVATYQALAALRSAAVNVRINLAMLDDTGFAQMVGSELDTIVAAAPERARTALETAYRIMNLSTEGGLPA